MCFILVEFAAVKGPVVIDFYRVAVYVNAVTDKRDKRKEKIAAAAEQVEAEEGRDTDCCFYSHSIVPGGLDVMS